MSIDLFTSLMNMNTGVAVPQGEPILQGENPLVSVEGLPPATVPAATPAPDVSANPTKQVKSLEEMLFGLGGFNG